MSATEENREWARVSRRESIERVRRMLDHREGLPTEKQGDWEGECLSTGMSVLFFIAAMDPDEEPPERLSNADFDLTTILRLAAAYAGNYIKRTTKEEEE